jgi:hypothetical protein
MALHPFNYIAWQEDVAIPDFGQHSSASWYDQLQHLLIIRFAIPVEDIRNPYNDRLASYCRYSHGRLKRFLETVVRPQQPDVAEALLKLGPSHNHLFWPATEKMMSNPVSS